MPRDPPIVTTTRVFDGEQHRPVTWLFLVWSLQALYSTQTMRTIGHRPLHKQQQEICHGLYKQHAASTRMHCTNGLNTGGMLVSTKSLPRKPKPAPPKDSAFVQSKSLHPVRRDDTGRDMSLRSVRDQQ